MFPVYEQKKENVHILQKTSRHAPPHLHNSVEFIYVISGSMEIGMGQELFHMDEGDFAVIFPDVIHHYQVFEKGKNKESISIAVDTMEELKKINNNDGMNKKKLKEIQDKEHRGEPFETLNIWNAIVTEQLKELLNRACEVQRVAGAWAALIAGPTVMSAIDIVYETEVDEFDNEELYTQGAYFILRAIMKMHGTEI